MVAMGRVQKEEVKLSYSLEDLAFGKACCASTNVERLAHVRTACRQRVLGTKGNLIRYMAWHGHSEPLLMSRDVPPA